MTPNEVAASARLGGRAAAGLTAHVEQVHHGIAERAFGGVGPLALPVKVVHDGVATLVYRSVGAALRGAGVAAGAALRTVTPSDAPPVSAHSGANQMLAALNAVVGAGL